MIKVRSGLGRSSSEATLHRVDSFSSGDDRERILISEAAATTATVAVANLGASRPRVLHCQRHRHSYIHTERT